MPEVCKMKPMGTFYTFTYKGHMKLTVFVLDVNSVLIFYEVTLILVQQ